MLPELEELVEAVAVEQAGRRGLPRVGASRNRAAADPCSCLKRRIRIDAWLNAECAGDDVDTRGHGRRRSGPPASTAAAVDGAAEIVVTGRPMKSRSLDGSQFQ